ncbi:MAG: hypothetical protein E6J90_19740 [Deltaproteobacteria bacterium]|nr:MAG: hypothetical protein E6J90_19740 [Deltaproteobacteria bacterium]
MVTFDGVAGDWRHSNPGADFQLMTYTYDGGFYDRREREFYGYAKVTSTMHDTRGLIGIVPDGFDKPYVRTTRTYQNNSFFAKGLLVSEVVEGLDTGAPRTFSRTENQYALREVDTQQVLTTPTALAETLSSVFPELRTAIRRRSEGDASASVQAEVDQTYDADGNVTQITDTGDVGTADDYTAPHHRPRRFDHRAECRRHHPAPPRIELRLLDRGHGRAPPGHGGPDQRGERLPVRAEWQPHRGRGPREPARPALHAQPGVRRPDPEPRGRRRR